MALSVDLSWAHTREVRLPVIFYSVWLEVVEKTNSRFRKHRDEQLLLISELKKLTKLTRIEYSCLANILHKVNSQ